MGDARDTTSLRKLIGREARRLVADRHEAADLTQECMLALHERGDTIRDSGRTIAWCHAVLRNLLRQRLRRRWYSEAVGLDGLPEARENPWEQIDTQITLRSAVDELAAPTARAMRDFYFGGRSIARIAADERRPVGTIKRWLHEGREALRMSLTETQQDCPLARVYASNWLDDAKRNITAGLTTAGYRPEISELGEEDELPVDADLYVLGHEVGCRSGLELLLYLRGKDETADRPVVLFGPGRHSAVFAAWKAGADTYLTDPSSDEVVHFLKKLREAYESGNPPRP